MHILMYSRRRRLREVANLDVFYPHYVLYCRLHLKVPKREIFDRSDFPDFYTMKSLCVSDFGVKIKKNLQIFRGLFRGAKFLTRMLSVFLRRFFF